MMRGTILIYALMFSFTCSTAYADARDEVEANVARCKVIVDPRTWLDCYYGAAQPMRAQLGLSPAPSFQTALVPSSVQENPARSAAPFGPNAVYQPTKTNDGFLQRVVGGQVVVNNARLASYHFDNRGYFTITLSNGQVWQQVKDGATMADWNEPPDHYSVTVRKGSFGSYNLQVKGESKLYKVRLKS